LAVAEEPVFVTQKLTVTVSFGSRAPFAGAQPSVTIVAPPETMIAVGARQRFRIALPPAVTVTIPVAWPKPAFDAFTW
jgi:hypothetical protein